MNHATTMDEAGVGPAAHASVPVSGTGVGDGKLGIWIFLASEVMFFAGLIGAYVVIRTGLPTWPNPADELNVPLTAFNTFILICSSVTMVKSLAAAHRDDQAGIIKFLGATIALGLFFLGVQAFEYHELYGKGLTPWRDLFGSCFYSMTGFHGAHVTIGVLWNICVFIGALRGKYGASYSIPIELAGLYWHFVDLVWIILFTILYLI